MIMDTFKKSKKNQLYYQISMNEITDIYFVINKFLLAGDKFINVFINKERIQHLSKRTR